MDDKLLTCTEVQAILRISKSKLYRLIHKEKLSVIRLGSTFRIRQSELEKFLKNNEKIIGGTRDDY
ncbi:MAG: helix-turn-helix domain-containing protein [Oscillospiraceae bacterium]|nr:helix-turn-helix domain-containing protein [Oscillospiraceae bacterium]